MRTFDPINDEPSFVRQLLGRVKAFNSGGPIDVGGEPEGNSTRWVFDLEQRQSVLTFELVLPYASTPVPTLRSFAFTPLGQDFWGARVYVVEQGFVFELHAQAPCDYRVAVDTFHSKNR